MLSEESLKKGGALHTAVARFHDSRSAHSVVYHPLVVGKRILTRGPDAPLRLEVCDGWEKLTAETAEVPSGTQGKVAYVWKPTSQRTLVSDVDSEGTVRFDFVNGKWQRHVYDDAIRCAWPGCPNRSGSTGMCAVHVQNLDEANPQMRLIKMMNNVKAPDKQVETLRHELRRSLLEEKADALLRAQRFLDAAASSKEEIIIWAQPESRFNVKKGSSVSLRIVATGASKFEWFKDGRVSRHSTNQPLCIVRGVDTTDEGQYRCRLDDKKSSDVVQLTVEAAAKRRDERKSSFHFDTASVDECEAALLIDIDDDKFNASVLVRLASLLASSGNKRKALYYASDAATRWPSSVDALLLKAHLAADLGYLEEGLRAVDAADRLRRISPEQRRSLDALKADLERRWAAAQAAAASAEDDDNTERRRYWRCPPRPPQPTPDQRRHAQDLTVLGLSTLPATRRDLRRIYLDLALKQHPDKGGDHNAFLEIQAAYERLTTAIV